MSEPRLRKGSPPGFPALVQQFFTEYLVAQRALSPRTVASYRDAMTLFLAYATDQLVKAPTKLQLTDITPELVLKFLAHLERERHNSVRSRNLRLTALRSFLRFAGRRDVSALHAVGDVQLQQMGLNSRACYEAQFQPDQLAAQLITRLEKLLDDRKRPHSREPARRGGRTTDDAR